MLDILDRLQATDKYVKLELKTGEIVFGKPDCIVYEEDEEGYDTIKQIRFECVGREFAVYYTADEIIDFDECDEGEIKHNKGANGNGQENDRDVKSGCRE